jgi:hypothetical protein
LLPDHSVCRRRLAFITVRRRHGLRAYDFNDQLDQFRISLPALERVLFFSGCLLHCPLEAATAGASAMAIMAGGGDVLAAMAEDGDPFFPPTLKRRRRVSRLPSQTFLLYPVRFPPRRVI